MSVRIIKDNSDQNEEVFEVKMMEDYLRQALCGEVEVITATELRAHPGECLTQCLLGKNFCIKRKGKIVAFLVAPENANVTHEIHPDGSAPTLGIVAKAVARPE